MARCFVQGAVVLVAMGEPDPDHVGCRTRYAAAPFDVGFGADVATTVPSILPALVAAVKVPVVPTVEVATVRITDLPETFMDREVVAVPTSAGPFAVATQARVMEAPFPAMAVPAATVKAAGDGHHRPGEVARRGGAVAVGSF